MIDNCVILIYVTVTSSNLETPLQSRHIRRYTYRLIYDCCNLPSDVRAYIADEIATAASVLAPIMQRTIATPTATGFVLVA